MFPLLILFFLSLSVILQLAYASGPQDDLKLPNKLAEQAWGLGHTGDLNGARQAISAGLSGPSPSPDMVLPQVDAFIATITEAVNKVSAALPADARY